MLELDLSRLEREQRLEIDQALAPDDPLWGGDVRLHGPLSVRLNAQRTVRGDVVVRGTLKGEIELSCRRCLEDVVYELEEPVSFVFRPGLERLEAERQEVYVLPSPARTVDLREPVREHVLLAVPPYPVCRETCQGLCPRCGKNLNEGPCGCAQAEPDERWGPLRTLKLD